MDQIVIYILHVLIHVVLPLGKDAVRQRNVDVVPHGKVRKVVCNEED